MSDVTRILNEISAGSAAASELFPAVYDELRRMAAARIQNEQPGNTLDATGLVHEAYLRLGQGQSFESRRHFFGAAAEAMRRILIDRARARKAEKRGGDAVRIELDAGLFTDSEQQDDRLETLNSAIEKFETVDSNKAELVKLRYFVGLSIKEAAEVIGISTATADRHWKFAKAWLQNEMVERG